MIYQKKICSKNQSYLFLGILYNLGFLASLYCSKYMCSTRRQQHFFRPPLWNLTDLQPIKFQEYIVTLLKVPIKEHYNLSFFFITFQHGRRIQQPLVLNPWQVLLRTWPFQQLHFARKIQTQIDGGLLSELLITCNGNAVMGNK